MPRTIHIPPEWRKVFRIAIVIAAIIAVSAGAYRARIDGSGTSDFDDFWRTARFDVLERRTMTDDYGVHNYLPFFGVAMIPFALLPLKPAAITFNLVGLAGFWWAFRALAAGDATPGSRHAPTAAWIALALVAAYVFDCMVMGQMSMPLAALLVACWRLWSRGRPISAGLVLAFAASLKLLPLVVAGYFVLKREGRVLLGLLAGLVVCNVLLPSVVFGPRHAWELHREFYQRSAQGQSLLALAAEPSDKTHYANQSLPVVLRRLTMSVPSGIRLRGQPQAVCVVEWGDRPVTIAGITRLAVEWLVMAVAGSLTLAAMWIARHAARRLSAARLRTEYSAFVLLSVVLSPVVWTFYFALAFQPLVTLGTDVRARRLAWPGSLVLAGWGLATPLLAWPHARAVGLHLWLTCLALVCLLASAAFQRARKK